MTTYYEVVGRPNGGSGVERIPRGMPVERLIGIVNDEGANPIDGMLARNNIAWTPQAKIAVVGIVLWLPEGEITGSGTPPTITIGKGSSKTNLLLSTQLSMIAEDDLDSAIGAGLWKIIDANEPMNIEVTVAASGYTRYRFVPLVYGHRLSRG